MTATSAPLEASDRVYLVEDEPILRDSLKAALEFSGYRVSDFSNAEALLESVDLGADPLSDVACIVTDIDLPGISGLQLQEALAPRSHLAVIVISGVATAGNVVSAYRAGAAEVLLKPFGIQDLLATIDHATTAAKARTVARSASEVWRKRTAKLTRRQRQVIALVAVGKLNREIADQLGIALRTVKLHRNRAFAQLGVARVADLVRNIADFGALDA